MHGEVGRIGPARASYVGVMVPVVALIISTIFENLSWHPLMIAGMLVSIAGNVLVLSESAPLAGSRVLHEAGVEAS